MYLLEQTIRPFSGSILQLGRQDIYFDYATLETTAKLAGVRLQTLEKITLRPNEWMPGVETLDDHAFFKSLGFGEVRSVDASDYENPDYVWDFNLPVPESMLGQFDVVLDEGSLEHIFHLPNALSNINASLKVGGRVIHHSPTHNWVDHGFFCFSPGFFWDFYEANGYSDLRCILIGMKAPFRPNEPIVARVYTPGSLESISIGGLTKETFFGCDVVATSFVATKTARSTGSVIPMQRRYREWWEKAQKNKKM